MAGSTVGGPVSPGQLDAAVGEVRSFVAHLKDLGVVAQDGSVAEPSAVVDAVRAQPERFGALGRAVANGAKDAVLCVVRGGVSALIVAIVGADQP